MRNCFRLLCLLALLVSFGACGGGGGGGGGDGEPEVDIEAEVSITALQIAEVTVFSASVSSVSGIDDAASFNLIGEETRPNTDLNDTADNFVRDTTIITLEVYDSAGDILAFAVLDATDYTSTFEGTITLSATDQSEAALAEAVGQTASVLEPPAKRFEAGGVTAAQIGNLDILASGIFDVLPTGSRSIQVPLVCGPTVAGNVTPDPDEGFFIINDVLIEYYYALANAVIFNDVLSVKFRESGRNFENMTLAFRLPNSANIYRIRPLPFKLLTTAEAQAILGNVVAAVNASNPFDTAVAYVDLVVTPFGPSYLVETIVTRVEGDCVAGARSFTVQEGNEAPEPPKAFLDQVDKNTLQEDLILLILGNEVEVREQELNTCGNWSPSNSGGSEGTQDNWDISSIATGATFDFEFEAFSEPDKFRVEYPPGNFLLNTGWRGSITPIDGVLEGPGAFDALNLFTKGASNTLTVLVTGGRPGTQWTYRVRCND